MELMIIMILITIAAIGLVITYLLLHNKKEKPNGEKVAEPKLKRNRIIAICIISILFVGGWILAIYSVDPATSALNNNKVSEYTLWSTAKIAVTDKLKNPATAVFPSSAKADIYDLKNNKYKIESYVDSLNNFGAIIRTEFIVVIAFNSGKYTVESCKLIQ